MAEVKNMLHKVQHLFLSTSVSAQSCRRRGGRDGKKGAVEERAMGGERGNGIGGGEERNGVKRKVGRGEVRKERRGARR